MPRAESKITTDDLKQTFDALAWVDAVDAIPGIDVYVGKQAGEEWWIRTTFWRMGDDEATEADRDR